MCVKFRVKFQAVAEKTAKNIRGLLYFAAPCTQWIMNDPERGHGQGHVTYFLNFGTPSITFERKTLDTLLFFLC